ncbi:MAG TPA: hypothetical protein VII91_06925 [Bauldia sp.]
MLRSIEIDFDVNKSIEMERRGFEETPNDVLRRLLSLGPAPASQPINSSAAHEAHYGGWEGEGVVLPNGTIARMIYNKRSYEAQIKDRLWWVNGRFFASPSDAASTVGVTKKGEITSLNGWLYWQVKRPGDADWIRIEELRRRARPTSTITTNKTAEELGV